jgi:hypothetical protein
LFGEFANSIPLPERTQKMGKKYFPISAMIVR